MAIAAPDKMTRSKPRASALVGSYVAEVKGWAGRIAAGYGIAAALLLGAVLALFGAIAVGFAALFHFVELRYGINIAFAALGGALVLLAVILLLAGMVVLKRRAAPLPRPHKQLRAARQMLIGPTVSRAVGALARSDAAKPDTTTQVLIGAAAVLAVGWIVATRRGSRPPTN